MRYLFCLFSLEVFWLFKHIPSSFYLCCLKGRSLLALLLQDVFPNLKPYVTFEEMDKRVFSFTLLAHPWKLLLRESLCSSPSYLSQKYFPETRYQCFSRDFWKRKGKDFMMFVISLFKDCLIRYTGYIWDYFSQATE